MRALSEGRYDLYLFDWMLPDMNGPDIMAGLKLDTRTVDVHSITATYAAS